MVVKKSEIKNFFEPRVVAIIGASENEGKVGAILTDKAKKGKFESVLANPNYKNINGNKCYKSVLDYSKDIDLAIIAIPADFVANALEECGKKGIKNVIIISAGFSEVGNKKGDEKLLAVARKYGIRYIGANCFGVCNPSLNIDLTFSASMPHKGNIAFISQSGALWSYISDLSAEVKEHFGFSSFVSLGNMDDLEFDDFLEYFCKDKNTKSIVMYVEKLKNGEKFIKICKSCSIRKKIYAVKGGSSSIGAKAEFSHTASLASDYSIYKGAFMQAKVTLCKDLVEAFEKASGKNIIDTNNKKLKVGKKMLIITNAGGAGVLFSDHMSEKGFNIIEKPLDILGTALSSNYASAFDSVKTKDFESIVVILTPQSMSEVVKTAEEIVKFQNKIKSSGKRVVALFLGGKEVKKANKIFEKGNIIYFNTLLQAKESLEN